MVSKLTPLLLILIGYLASCQNHPADVAQPDTSSKRLFVIGRWWVPHAANIMLQFNIDHTFETDYVPAPSGDTAMPTTIGTYTFNGQEGWLIFKNGQKRKFLREPPPRDDILKVNYFKLSEKDYTEFIR